MQVTTEEMFAIIGRQQVELEILRRQNQEVCADNARLLGEAKMLRERNGTPAEGKPVEN
jgi:hypothetical protein